MGVYTSDTAPLLIRTAGLRIRRLKLIDCGLDLIPRKPNFLGDGAWVDVHDSIPVGMCEEVCKHKDSVRVTPKRALVERRKNFSVHVDLSKPALLIISDNAA